MRTDKATVVICILCIAAVALAFYSKHLNAAIGTRQPATVAQEMGSDPYTGGRITIHYHERHPYYVSHGKRVGGIIGDRINLVFNQAKIPLAWQKSPAKRQLDIIKKNEHREGAAGWFRTPERETFAKYSLPIYQDRSTIALSRADRELILSGRPVAETLSNRRLRLLRKDGYSYGQFIDRQLERFQPNQIITSTDNLGMLKMVHSHRADYFFIAEEEADVLLTRAQLPASDFKIITFPDIPEGNLRYILFSMRVEASTIDRLNRVILNYHINEPDDGNAAR